jgi:hypothetical protein
MSLSIMHVKSFRWYNIIYHTSICSQFNSKLIIASSNKRSSF